MKKYRLVLALAGIAFCIFVTALTACNNQQAEKENNTNNQNVQTNAALNVINEDNSGIIVQSPNVFEYRFYSPDKKHYVSEKLDLSEPPEGEPPPIETQIYYDGQYIDKSRYVIDGVYKQNRTRAIWINNQDVLINGLYLYNINDKQKTNIPFPKDFLENNFLLNWRLQPGGTLIAYYCVSESNMVGTRYMVKLSLMIFDTKLGTIKSIPIKEIAWSTEWALDSGFYQIFWDAAGDNIYFRYDIGNKYLKVMKYDLSTGNFIEVSGEYDLYDASPDGKYFIVETLNPQKDREYYLAKSDDYSILAQIPSYRYAWSDTNPLNIGVIIRDGGKKFHIEIFSVKEKKIIGIYKNEQLVFPPGDYSLAYIDYFDGNYVIGTPEHTFMIRDKWIASGS